MKKILITSKREGNLIQADGGKKNLNKIGSDLVIKKTKKI